jgi:hypothetical protein
MKATRCCGAKHLESERENFGEAVQVLGQESERCIQAERTCKQGEEIGQNWLT